MVASPPLVFRDSIDPQTAPHSNRRLSHRLPGMLAHKNWINSIYDCRSMVYGIVSVMNVPLPSIKQISRPFPIVVLQVDGFNPM